MHNLNDFYLFVQVVEHGGFAPTSRRLGIPKSTLSKRVAALESALGARLIHRTSRGFTVTETGRDFHRHAAAMLIEAEAAEQVVKGRQAEPSGTVRIAASIPTAQISLAPLLPRLSTRYPRVHIMLEASDRFVDVVQEGFDIALRDHFAPLPDSGMVQRRLGFDPGYLVAAPEYVRRCGAPTSPLHLVDHEGLLTGPAGSTWALQHPREGAVVVAPRPRFTANESEVLLRAASAGLGVASLPGKLCQPALARDELCRILPEWTAPGVTTTLLMPHRRGQLPAVRVIADALVEELGTES